MVFYYLFKQSYGWRSQINKQTHVLLFINRLWFGFTPFCRKEDLIINIKSTFIFLHCNKEAVRKTPLQMCAVMPLQLRSSLIWTCTVHSTVCCNTFSAQNMAAAGQGLLSALSRACWKIKNNKGVGVGPCVAASAPNVYNACLVCGTPLQSALIDLCPWTLDADWPLQ